MNTSQRAPERAADRALVRYSEPRDARPGPDDWQERLALRNWSLPVKLGAVLLVPTLFVLTLGVLRIVDQTQKAASYDGVQQAVSLEDRTSRLLGTLAAERSAAAVYVASNRAGGSEPVDQRVAATNAAVTELRRADGGADSLDEQTRTAFDAANAELGQLDRLRDDVLNARIDAAGAIARYTETVGALLTFDRSLSREAADPSVAGLAAGLYALSVVREEDAYVQAVVAAGIAAGRIDAPSIDQARNATLRRSIAVDDFRSAVGTDNAGLADAVVGPDVDNRDRLAQVVLGRGAAGLPLQVPGPEWEQASTAVEDRVQGVSQQLRAQLQGQAGVLQQAARNGAGVASVILLLAMMAGAAVVFFVTRSLLRPLRLLRRTALDVAERRLPQAVRSLREGEMPDTTIVPTPITTREEIGEVARAFDQVHEQAVRLAAEQAGLRSAFNSIFVNLSRRSQALVERQLRLIEQLESSEQDPDALANLFQLDHLATRMRRNSENLLVLSGTDLSRRGSRPVPLVDVLRAAASEVEQYQRIDLAPPPRAQLIGRTASDVVHLVAELLENATTFSAPDTRVQVRATQHHDGSILVEILDLGVGMSEEDLHEANMRLSSPPTVDVSASRRMGLFVVGRLATRHGIAVELRNREEGGLAATALVPASAVLAAVPEGPAGAEARRGGRGEGIDGPAGHRTAVPAQGRRGGSGLPQRAQRTAGAPSGFAPTVDPAEDQTGGPARPAPPERSPLPRRGPSVGAPGTNGHGGHGGAGGPGELGGPGGRPGRRSEAPSGPRRPADGSPVERGGPSRPAEPRGTGSRPGEPETPEHRHRPAAPATGAGAETESDAAAGAREGGRHGGGIAGGMAAGAAALIGAAAARRRGPRPEEPDSEEPGREDTERSEGGPAGVGPEPGTDAQGDVPADDQAVAAAPEAGEAVDAPVDEEPPGRHGLRPSGPPPGSRPDRRGGPPGPGGPGWGPPPPGGWRGGPPAGWRGPDMPPGRGSAGSPGPGAPPGAPPGPPRHADPGPPMWNGAPVVPPPPPASPPSAEGPEDLREPAFPEVPDEADEGQEQLRADEAVDERPDAADLPPAGPATAETGRATDATAAGGAPERASGTAADDASSAESSGSGAAEGGPTSLPSRTTGARRATFPLRPRVVRPEARRAASDAGADTGEAAAPTADTAGPDVAPGAVAGSVTDTGRHAGALEAGATEGFATEGERAVVGPHTAEPYPSASEGPDPGGLRPDGPAGDAAPGSGPAEAVAPDDEGAPAAPAHAGTDAGGATGTPGAAGETRDRPPARRRPPMGAPLTPGAAPRLRPRRPAGPPAGSEVAGGPAAGPEPASGEDLFDPGRPTRAVPERIPMRAGTPHRERTPIYDEVASAWFRESPPSAGPDEAEWASSTGDEGWRAAAASADALDAGLGGAGTTEAGLPRRRPRAHLVPGAARPGGAGEGPAPGPAGPRRSAEAIRGRLASYQQGVADGRTTRRARADTEGEPGARPGDEEEQ